jgi:uncharacterized protein YjdB
LELAAAAAQADKAVALAKAAAEAQAKLAAAKTSPVVKVKTAQSSLTLKKKQSATVPAGVYYADGKAIYWDALTWKSSNTRVAKVNQNGKITAIKKGAATITVTTKDANAKGKKVSTKIKVKVVTKKPNAKVTKVSASVPKTMKVGQISYITGKYTSTKATGVQVSYTTKKYQVAVIDKVGRIVTKSRGTDVITVKAGKKTKKYTITVT